MLKQISHLKGKITIYALAGLPGCGKDTKATILTSAGKRLGIGHIVTSKVIDEHIAKETDLGAEFKKFAEKRAERGLLPDELILRALGEKILEQYRAGKKRIILNGSPRTSGQAQAIIACGIPYVLFHIDVNERTSFARVDERAQKESRSDNGSTAKGVQVFKELTLPGLRLMRNHNPNAYEVIRGEDPIRSQVIKMARGMDLSKHDLAHLVKNLDHPSHPARILINEIEGNSRRSPMRISHR